MRSRYFSLHKEVPFLRKKKARHAVVVSRPNATFRPHVRHGPLRFDLRCLLLFPVRAISKCSRTPPTFLFVEAGYPVPTPLPETARNIKRNNICIAWVYINPLIKR